MRAAGKRNVHVAWPRLAALPPSIKIGVVVALVGLLSVQAVAAAGVWVHTRVVHGSVAEYFFHLSVPRLIGISHTHLFGYVVLYGLIGGIGTLTDATERVKTLLLAVPLWSGIFDVASWWGIKLLSPKFEIVSLMTALTSSGASCAVTFLVVRALRRERAG
ncbi:MAG: hypothetical protein H7Z43_02580 [Clostridia bacterium]|nr:hypothetical protein [Deltaproteobacteria bacterium]